LTKWPGGVECCCSITLGIHNQDKEENTRKLSLSLAVALLLAVVVVYSVAQKKAGASDAQYVTQAPFGSFESGSQGRVGSSYGRQWKNDNPA